MICRCLIVDKPGIYINDSVLWDEGGHKYSSTYHKDIHTLIKDAGFDYQMIGFRCFYHHLQRRKIKKFYRSCLFREDMCVKMMFKSMNIFNSCIERMKKFNILTIDGKLLCLGEEP